MGAICSACCCCSCRRCGSEDPAPADRSDTFDSNDLRLDCDKLHDESEFVAAASETHRPDSPGQTKRRSSECIYYAQVLNERAKQRATLSDWQQQQSTTKDNNCVVLVSGNRALRVEGNEPALRRLANSTWDLAGLNRARQLFELQWREPVHEAIVTRSATFSPLFSTLEAQASALAELELEDGGL